MNHDTFKSWLDAYGKAWETRDPQAAGALFAEDATYAEVPFDEPMKGREAIEQYWAENVRIQEDIRFRHEILAVSGHVGIARWRASYSRLPERRRRELDGILLAAFNVDAQCVRFEEWWHTREGGAA